MRGANFVAFFTASGFFIGIVFSLLKSNDAFDLITYTVLITLFFYLFSHLSIAMFINTITDKSAHFSKVSYEKDLDSFVREINKREKLIDVRYDFSKGEA